MNTHHHPYRLFWRLFWIAVLILLGCAGAAFAQDEGDPPGRAALVSYRQGGVVYAPDGEEEWTELPPNRPLTMGDRMWTDRGARAELQLGSATLHLDGESHLGLGDLDERSAKFILQQGSINLRVRELVQGENVEVDTPNLAFRALQPGDYRIDVDPASGETRVSVRNGLAALFGEGGESIQMGAGQAANFGGRYLAQVDGPRFAQDDFGLWAAERNRQEDQSIAARYVPRGVVGSSQLDPYGTWTQDPTYGAVWYPTVAAQDWAPYRYGHWDWVSPWGWTWIDDAPWGFAPFHYGRWTMIGSRWCWVPGRLAARPVYSPALVVFLGGGRNHIAINSGPGVGWYPLAPGEAWWPAFRASPRYVSHVNFNININSQPRHFQNHVWRNRPFAVTAVAEDDFRHGRQVDRNWHRLPAQVIGNAQVGVVPVRPELRHRGEFQHGAQRLQGTPPAATQPASTQPAGNMQPPAPGLRRPWGGREAAPAGVQPAPNAQPGVQRIWGREPAPNAVQAPSAPQPGAQRLWGGRELRVQREQERLQQDAERAAREQQRSQEQTRQLLDAQRGQQLHQQQEAVQRQQEAVQRQQQEAARRQQQQQFLQQRQQEAAQRQQQQQQWLQQRQQEREQAILRAQQERAQREAQRPQPGGGWHQNRGAPPQVTPPQAQVAPQVHVPQQQVRPVQQAVPVGRGHGGGAEQPAPREGEAAPPRHGFGARWQRN